MENKMLVTQALDERTLLVKKISDKIERARFIDVIRKNETKVLDEQIRKEEFVKQAKAAYQQIIDLIERYQKIDIAIVASNANTTINTSYGTFTIAGAISLRNRLRNKDEISNTDFELDLCQKMEQEYYEYIELKDIKNRSLDQTAEQMRLSILGKENKYKEDKPLQIVEAYVKENTIELVDTLNLRKKIEEIKDRRNTLLNELETQIKVSNATTYIELS